MTVMFALEEEFEMVHITEDDMTNANSSSASAPDTPPPNRSVAAESARPNALLRYCNVHSLGVSQSIYPYAIASLTEPRSGWHRSTSDHRIPSLTLPKNIDEYPWPSQILSVPLVSAARSLAITSKHEDSVLTLFVGPLIRVPGFHGSQRGQLS